MLLNYENWSSTTTPTPFFTLLVRQFKNSNISVSGFHVLPVLCSSRFGCAILMIYFWTLSYKVCEALGLASATINDPSKIQILDLNFNKCVS